MSKRKKISDVYKFPGFVPGEKIAGIFGDSQALVIRLRRIEKKRYAQSA